MKRERERESEERERVKRERERERERERGVKRERERQTDRQTDRLTDRRTGFTIFCACRAKHREGQLLSIHSITLHDTALIPASQINIQIDTAGFLTNQCFFLADY